MASARYRCRTRLRGGCSVQTGCRPLCQDSDAVQALLRRREHAPQHGQVLGSQLGAELDRSLHLQLLDAQVALGVVVNRTLRSCTNRSKNYLPLRKRTRGCGPAVGSCGPSSPAAWAAPVILQPFLQQSVEATLNPLDQRFGSFTPRPAPLRRQIGPPQQLSQLPAHFCLPESTSACSSRRWCALHVACPCWAPSLMIPLLNETLLLARNGCFKVGDLKSVEADGPVTLASFARSLDCHPDRTVVQSLDDGIGCEALIE